MTELVEKFITKIVQGKLEEASGRFFQFVRKMAYDYGGEVAGSKADSVTVVFDANSDVDEFIDELGYQGYEIHKHHVKFKNGKYIIDVPEY